jgi:hypothetical protein
VRRRLSPPRAAFSAFSVAWEFHVFHLCFICEACAHCNASLCRVQSAVFLPIFRHFKIRVCYCTPYVASVINQHPQNLSIIPY